MCMSESFVIRHSSCARSRHGRLIHNSNGKKKIIIINEITIESRAYGEFDITCKDMPTREKRSINRKNTTEHSTRIISAYGRWMRVNIALL